MSPRPARRLALLATDSVGLDVARLVAARSPAVCLVLDEADREHVNDEIVASHPAGTPVLLAGELRGEAGLARFAGCAPDLGLLAWWPHIVGAGLLAVPRDGFVNLHPSLLPHQRGRDPYFWALRERSPYGVTLHRVTLEVDAGDVLAQTALPVDWTDTAQTLNARSRRALVELVERSLPLLLDGDLTGRRQPDDAPPAHRRAELEPASRIELDAATTPRDVLDLLRARTFPPHPAAWFEDGGRRYEVRVEVRDVGPAGGSSG